MSSSVDANVFKVRHHSAIIIDAPILISFLMPVFLPICLFINFSRKPSQNWFTVENLIEHALYEIIADPIEIIGDIYWQISVAQPKPQTLYSELTKHYV